MLPKGYDAEDVADQAIKEMLSGNCRLAVGFVRERIVKEMLRHI